MIATLPASRERPVVLPAGRARLSGTLAWPERPSGLVLFAHGGGGRLSSRSQLVAEQVRACGLATLLVDLLSDRESADRSVLFDVDLLTARLLAATEWAVDQPEAGALPLGYYGAGAGAPAALEAAARSPVPVQAIVCRAGRLDLVGEGLHRVAAPTLLVVGGRDTAVLELNRQALCRLTCTKRLVVVPGAGPLFEEPGTLEDAGRWTGEWFIHYLAMERTWHRARA